MEQTRRARLTGLTAALLTVAAILWTLFASPSIGVVADGSYASAAEGLALRYAEESIPTGQRVEDFAYEDTAYSTLLFASRTSVGAAVALMVDWRVFLIVVAAFIIVVAITKIVSVSSMAAAFLLPVSYSILGVLKVFELCLPKLILSLFVGVLIIVLHYKNIVRLFKGEEKKFSFKKKSDKE